MDVFLGWAAFAGAVFLVCIVRSVLMGSLSWSRRAATAVAMGAPLFLAVISIALALTDAASTDGTGGTVWLAVLLFSLIALVVGGAGVAMSKLVRGEFSSRVD